MTLHRTDFLDIVRRDPRYAPEAYEFVLEALAHTQRLFDRPAPNGPSDEIRPEHHVSGPELLEGVRDLALREFGLMARVVFKLWGIDRTDDVGEIIFNLIDAGQLCKTDNDSRADFHDVYDLDKALVDGFAIRAEELDGPRRGER
jgi:uncharacterized repeat protein (TIGR04138 family)